MQDEPGVLDNETNPEQKIAAPVERGEAKLGPARASVGQSVTESGGANEMQYSSQEQEVAAPEVQEINDQQWKVCVG